MATEQQAFHVVILGLGYAGVAAVNLFREKSNSLNGLLRVTAISENDYFYHNVAAPRSLADNTIRKVATLPMTKLWQGTREGFGTFVHGSVITVQKDHVVIKRHGQESEERVDFDFCIISLGISYSDPMKPPSDITTLEAAKSQSKMLFNAVKDAASILVVGGGSAGIEVAGEIKSAYKDKKVTLLHAHSDLMPVNPLIQQKLRDKLKSELESLGVELVLGERILPNEGQSTTRVGKPRTHIGKQILKTDKGREIESDVQFYCVGGSPNVTPVVNGLGSDTLNPNGFIQVNQFLQVADNKHIFSIGDCSNAEKGKLAYFAKIQADFVVRYISKAAQTARTNNVKPSELGELPLKPYQTVSTEKYVQIVPVGPNKGAVQFNKTVMGRIVTNAIKNGVIKGSRILPHLQLKMSDLTD